VPHLRFALSRDFANSGWLWTDIPRAALGACARPPSLALGYYRSPLQGFDFALSFFVSSRPPKQHCLSCNSLLKNSKKCRVRARGLQNFLGNQPTCRPGALTGALFNRLLTPRWANPDASGLLEFTDRLSYTTNILWLFLFSSQFIPISRIAPLLTSHIRKFHGLRAASIVEGHLALLRRLRL
jgi:hypothetical protein